MSMTYLKKALRTSEADDPEVRETVRAILQDIRANGESAVRRYAEQFDQWKGDFVVAKEEIERASSLLSNEIKEDIRFAHEQIYGFAKKQRDNFSAFETELYPGVTVGQKLVPVHVAGCYVPGGRFPHVASALMSIATARAAGVPFVVAAAPPHRGNGIHAATLYAMSISQADVILTIGGVHGIASLAYGLFSGKPADVVVGPGNRYVAEAKRFLFGEVGIDLFAGPSEILIIADETADPHLVACDLISQAEHGYDSPTVLVTTCESLATKVGALVPDLIERLPAPDVSRSSWRDYGEIVWVDSREEAIQISDGFAPEHLEIQAADVEWWLARLTNYGSIFLGEETTVAYGDKASGPNHILPTKKAARYTGGLSVSKFIKILTYQRLSRRASQKIGSVSARISRLEGMEAHARSCDARLKKYCSDEEAG